MTSYQPDCDWVEGELRERVTGERLHSAMLSSLLFALVAQEKTWGILVLPILRIRVSETRYRVADVCVIRGHEPFEAIVTIAPLLCIEIVSPDDRMSAMMEKIDDYLAMGVELVWLIDPWRRAAYVVDARGYMRVEVLPVPETGIELAVRDLFADLE